MQQRVSALCGALGVEIRVSRKLYEFKWGPAPYSESWVDWAPAPQGADGGKAQKRQLGNKLMFFAHCDSTNAVAVL